ncbi:unnamed protein product [Cladocopium goreaui]|uniref:Uncharacterized protein n=1 Tax=Cladocopium goreaui TaxID=2562237 RepID=A0A9P1D2Y6_9DINO|nr:unnamed protein product [Cladocopium goreaui]CAI4002399.1 unnamed protein product [Cladocopium goreaui]
MKCMGALVGSTLVDPSKTSWPNFMKKLRKFLESMIQKSGKIRSLVREIADVYSKSDVLQKSKRQLEDELQKLDGQYDVCNNVMAKGEVNGFGPECSTACAAEAKTRNAKRYEKKDADLPGSPPVKKEKKDKTDKRAGNAVKAFSKDIGQGVLASKGGDGLGQPLVTAWRPEMGKVWEACRHHSVLPSPLQSRNGWHIYHLNFKGISKRGCKNMRLGGDTVNTEEVDGVSSCRAAIRAAKGIVSDLGEDVAAKSRGLTELSRCHETTSERDVERLTRKFNLSLRIPITELQKSPGVRYTGTFHVIALRDWIQYIVSHGLWHVLLGLHNADGKRERAILREFWRLYRIAHPQHQLFDAIQKYAIDEGRLLPVLMHGDEGRGRKKSPFLVTSFHSVLGFGTNLANSERKRRKYLSMKLNYCGSTNTSRMISGCLPKMSKDEAALQDLLTYTTGDCWRMLEHGVLDADGQRYHAACINAVGDWMWLAKAGNLERSFSNVPKKPLVAGSRPKGICHLCLAGRPGFDFENLSSDPAWLGTLFTPGDEPWKSKPILLSLPHDPARAAGFFAYDVWHAFHLGLGKSFVAAVLACISDRFGASTVDARFLELTDLYLQFCDESREPAYITAITKESCGWPDRKTFPNGQWHKGHGTTTLLRFLESWFSKNNVADDLILSMCAEAVVVLNRCFHEMYASDLWLEVSACHRIGGIGMQFLCLYQRLALEAFSQSKALFAYLPKCHIVHHIMMGLAKAHVASLNPLTFGVQIDEDFIGKKSRVARRVAPTQVIKRVLQRSLQIAYADWQEAGYIK